jgi:hypothetical protein
MAHMSEYKKYTWRVLAILFAFVAMNAVIWKCWTENILAGTYNGGDLARMGYLPGSKILRKNHVDLPLRHLEESEYRGQPIRVLTIGDSFSNGGGGGKNRYYQDYIASFNRCTVLNIEPYQVLDPLNLAVIFNNNGYLDRIKPKYLIIGATEKFCVAQYAAPLNFKRYLSPEQFGGLKRMGYNAIPRVKVSFINEGNFKFLYYNLLYLFSDHAYVSKTYVRDLDRPLFSVGNGKKLLFYRDDMRNVPLSTPKTVAAVNDNLNTLADLLRRKGIRLYFMPCVDKYNLYSKFIVDNPYPASTFFEELRKLPKRYVLIDTKKLLLEDVERGEKDVFYPDDTHWSWKAAEKIFSEIGFE